MRLALPLLVSLVIACGRDPRPDVLLIVLDTVRADHLSVYGYGRETTPGLADLARDAVIYRNAISPGTWTAPSHASLFTGLAPAEHGVHHGKTPAGQGIFALDPSVPTLTARLREAGYRTAAFVGNEGFLDPSFGFARDFEEYRLRSMHKVTTLATTVRAWLRRRRGRSVFVFLNVFDAHEPYEPPAPYDRMFPGRLEKPPERHPGDRAAVQGVLPDTSATAHYISQYDGDVRHMDDELRRIVQALRETGRYDNALVVVTADHGELFGEAGRWGHGGDPMRSLVHVPLIVKYPQGVRRGAEERPVSLMDIPATILAVLGLPPLGANQVPLWEHTGPAIAEQVAIDGMMTRAVYDVDGSERIERAPAPPPMHQGPLVVPEAERRLADRLRALGYAR